MRTSTARHLPPYASTLKHDPKVHCHCVGTATAETSIKQSALECPASQQDTQSAPTAPNSDMHQHVPRLTKGALTFLESLEIRQALVPYLARLKCFYCTILLSALLIVVWCCSCRNFALIEEQNVSFKPGLNVITGESGAGKSVLVEALGQVHNTTWNISCSQSCWLAFMHECVQAHLPHSPRCSW